jgi:hypothetical protein
VEVCCVDAGAVDVGVDEGSRSGETVLVGRRVDICTALLAVI